MGFSPGLLDQGVHRKEKWADRHSVILKISRNIESFSSDDFGFSPPHLLGRQTERVGSHILCIPPSLVSSLFIYNTGWLN